MKTKTTSMSDELADALGLGRGLLSWYEMLSKVAGMTNQRRAVDSVDPDASRSREQLNRSTMQRAEGYRDTAVECLRAADVGSPGESEHAALQRAQVTALLALYDLIEARAAR
jgi:hypothetical protein